MKLLLAAACAVVLLPVGGYAQRIDTMEIRSSTHFLASDLLEGRGTGTRGERLAALYLSSELQRLGLQPLGPGSSYLLPVPLKAATIDNGATRLVIRQGADSSVLASSKDYVVNGGGAAAFHDFSGEAVLVGPASRAAVALPAGSLQGKVLVAARRRA